MVFVVIATITMVIVACVIRIDGIEESTQADERSVREAHQQDGDARGSPSEVGKVGFDFVVVCLFLGFFEGLDFGFAGVGCFRILVGVLCIFILVNGVFVSVMLDVGDTNAHGGEGEHTDGEEHATDQHGAHPDAVLNVGFSTAHSSPSSWPTAIPFGSALTNRSISEGSSL